MLSNGLSLVLKAVPSLKSKVTAAGLASGDMLFFWSLEFLCWSPAGALSTTLKLYQKHESLYMDLHMFGGFICKCFLYILNVTNISLETLCGPC